MQCRRILGHTVRCMMTQDPTLMSSFPLHSLRTRLTSLIQARWSTVQPSTMRYKGLAIQMLTSSSLVHIECMHQQRQRPGLSHSIRGHIAWSMLKQAQTLRRRIQQNMSCILQRISLQSLLHTAQANRSLSMMMANLKLMSSFQLHMERRLLKRLQPWQ